MATIRGSGDGLEVGKQSGGGGQGETAPANARHREPGSSSDPGFADPLSGASAVQRSAVSADRSRPPSLALRLLNPIAVAVVTTVGLAPAGMMVLRVQRRGSGGIQRVPLNVLVHKGAYHVVSLHGESDWIANLRRAGRASLVRGRANVPVEVAEELDEEQRIPVLHAYLERWDGQLGVALGLDRSASDEELRAIAAEFPVIRFKLAARV